MDFYQMGKLDFQNEVSKSSSLGDKAITLRLDENFADFQSILSSKIGISRQSFLSNIVAEYTVEAISDYLLGYYEDIQGDIDVADFLTSIPSKHSDLINRFRDDLENVLLRKKIESKAWNAYEGSDKEDYLKSQVSRLGFSHV